MRYVLWAGLVVVIVAVGAWLLWGRSPANAPAPAGGAGTQGTGNKEESAGTEERQRGVAKLAGKNKEGKLSGPLADKASPPGDEETVPIPPDANPAVKSVAEAARTGEHPERLTPLLKAKPFNRAAFEADPLAFCQVSEPGRVWQTAEPGPNVKALQAKGVALVNVPKGGKVKLAVRGEPKGPVSFTSLDGGQFPNLLTAITVLADEQGEASVDFTASPGTAGDVHILAACPLTVGQVQFRVRVK